jgi:arylsulfatase A-like enzyme
MRISTMAYWKQVLFVTACIIQSLAAKQPNILFIEIDDLNYKYSSLAENKLVETPVMDSIATSGTYFQNAVCQGMMCGPSRNSLISGLYPHSMGFYRNGQMNAFPTDTWMFPLASQRSGYYTAYIGKSHIKALKGVKNMGPEMGFDHAEFTAGRAVLLSKARKGQDIKDWYFDFLKQEKLYDTLLEDDRKKRYSTLPEDAYLDGFFTKASMDFLDTYQGSEPFFLWVNYSLPHGPHDVSKEYHTSLPEDMPGIRKANFTPPAKLIKDTKPAKPTMKKIQAEYCGAIRFLDRQIGRIMENLKKNNMLDNTVVVLFSDHGIMMGDHSLIHKGTLFRQITTPTLLISWPKGFKQGQVVTHPVELMDLIPTALDLAGGLKWDTRPIKAGESLLPFLTGKGQFQRKLAFGEVESYVTVVDGHYRLIRGEGRNLLFDDISDPDNLTNIAEHHPQLAAQLGNAIDEWLKKTGPVRPAGYYREK